MCGNDVLYEAKLRRTAAALGRVVVRQSGALVLVLAAAIRAPTVAKVGPPLLPASCAQALDLEVRARPQGWAGTHWRRRGRLLVAVRAARAANAATSMHTASSATTADTAADTTAAITFSTAATPAAATTASEKVEASDGRRRGRGPVVVGPVMEEGNPKKRQEPGHAQRRQVAPG